MLFSTFTQSIAAASLFAPAGARLGGQEDDALKLRDIPPLGLGTWLSDRDKVSRAVQFALDDGYNHVDAALIYRNEDMVGKGISSSGAKRNDIWVTSKLWNDDHRPAAVRKAIEKSISDLGVDYLDLYLIHWPVAWRPDSQDLDKKTSLVDTWRAMEDLVRDKKTRYIGVSNFAPADIDTIMAICDICPYAHEFETHPYLQQQAFVDYHTTRGIKVIAYSPLANTNPHYDSDVPSILDDPFWKDIAATKNATVPQTVLAWGIQRGTIVIPKSVHKDYIDENLGARDIVFAEEELVRIAEQDKKIRMNDPGKGWGVDLFDGLDDPTSSTSAGDMEAEL